MYPQPVSCVALKGTVHIMGAPAALNFSLLDFVSKRSIPDLIETTGQSATTENIDEMQKRLKRVSLTQRKNFMPEGWNKLLEHPSRP